MYGQDTGPFFMQWMLHLLSIPYGAGAKIREDLVRTGHLPARKLKCPVISLGNITVGGTGKTPMAQYLAEQLKNMGLKVVVLSRGYSGGAEKKGAVVGNGKKLLIPVDEAGDEPFMLAKNLETIPVIVGSSRYQAGLTAINMFDPDVVLLDDGFQHYQLERDLNIVLLDGAHPFGNGHLLPRGTLREPISSLRRADAFILTRWDKTHAVDQKNLMAMAGKRPVFKSRHVPVVRKLIVTGKCCDDTKSENHLDLIRILQSQKVFGFSGLANNSGFKKTIASFDCDMKGFKGFPDHHFYSEKDLSCIGKAAQRSHADLIVTTEKDFVKFSNRIKWPMDLAVIGIDIEMIPDSGSFLTFIDRFLNIQAQ